MESLAPSSSSSSKKPPIDPSPPLPPPPTTAGSGPRRSRPSLPRRSRNRSLAFSVKEVKQAALRLQRPEKGSGSDAAGADLGRSDDALSFVERQLRTESDRRSSPLKPNPQIRLPEKYEILCEFFNSMESSIRLLRLKGSMLTFPSICTSTQHLTERRFTYEHLAQIKHILSESILIKKVLLRDETTCCMKPELQITLQLEAVGSNSKQKGETGYSILRRLFRERLVDFFKEHPEGDEIPVAELPYPFNRTKPSEIATSEPRAITDLQFAESPSISSPLHQPVVLSHMSQSFRKRFSQKKDALPDSCTTSFACIRSASQRDDPPVSLLPSSKQSVPKPPVITKSLQSSPISKKKVEGTPAKLSNPPPKPRTPCHSEPAVVSRSVAARTIYPPGGNSVLLRRTAEVLVGLKLMMVLETLLVDTLPSCVPADHTRNICPLAARTVGASVVPADHTLWCPLSVSLLTRSPEALTPRRSTTLRA
uniref:CDT1 Geminin-binding domain-containing protein n=1 Tax=Ananas comosus var. bracteatus TaxID=296719 RepID=A0A6V7Q2G9_ANACO|nr:unnamed protein product [Ananas comosus var. bracteatus]